MIPEQLSQAQFNGYKWLRLRADWLAQNKPEELEYLIGASTGEEVDIATMSPDEIFFALLESFDDNLSLTSQNLSTAQIPDSEALVSQLQSASSMSSARTICNDWAALNYGDAPPCEYENPPSDGYGAGSGTVDWYGGDDGSDDPSWWSTAGNWVLDVADDIGWDVIAGWLIGGSDDDDDSGSNNDNNSGGGSDDDDNDDQQGTDWGKIAMISGGVIVVGIGVYLIVKRK